MVVLERGDVRRKGGYQNRLSKNVRYSVHNVNACFNTFSFSFKLLLGENTFLWNISKRLLRVDILQKSTRKHPWSLKKVFLIMLQTLYLKFYKNVILTSMFSYKFWEFFRATFLLKTLCDYLWMRLIYSVKMHLQNTSKNFAKNMWLM